ncbi:MAG: hypothetical protein AAF657_40100, partial [Acidobacteriota bacterium]
KPMETLMHPQPNPIVDLGNRWQMMLALGLLVCGWLAAVPAAASQTESSPSTCRALVNIAGVPGEPEGDLEDGAMVDFVVDLRVGDQASVEVGRGMVVRDGDTTYALQRIATEREETGPAGTVMERRWNDLVATRLPDGEPKVWLAGEPERVFPPEGNDYPYEAYRFYSVTNLVGPYLSIQDSIHGFTGGPHGYTDDTFSLVRAPAAQPVAADFLGDEAMAAMVTAVRLAGEARNEGGDSAESDLDPPEDLSEAGLSFGPDGRLQLSTVLFCCTWAENHNQLQVDATLAEVPESLQPYLTLAAAPEGDQGWWIEAPDGCGALRLADGSEGLKVREGRGGASQTVRLPGLEPQRLLGVYWIPADDPFAVSMLPKAP